MLLDEILTTVVGISLINVGLVGMYFTPNSSTKLEIQPNIDYSLTVPLEAPDLSSLSLLQSAATAQSTQILNKTKIVTTGAKETPRTNITSNTNKTSFPAVPSTASLVAPTKTQQSPQITISKIGLNTVNLSYGSATVPGQVENQLLYKPVVENKLSVNLCSDTGNAYIYGHSEPSVASTRGYPGVYIFSNLHTLKAGDKIEVTNNKGVTCSYTVTNWDKVTTDSENRVSDEDFNRTFYPDTNGQGMLTIQTCQKGSSTVRLLLRAKLDI